MNSEIKLEVGKTYECRNPDKAKSMELNPLVTIIAEDHDDERYPFIGDDETTYCTNGKLLVGGKLSDYDLVREVTPQNKQ